MNTKIFDAQAGPKGPAARDALVAPIINMSGVQEQGGHRKVPQTTKTRPTDLRRFEKRHPPAAKPPDAPRKAPVPKAPNAAAQAMFDQPVPGGAVPVPANAAPNPPPPLPPRPLVRAVAAAQQPAQAVAAQVAALLGPAPLPAPLVRAEDARAGQPALLAIAAAPLGDLQVAIRDPQVANAQAPPAPPGPVLGILGIGVVPAKAADPFTILIKDHLDALSLQIANELHVSYTVLSMPNPIMGGPGILNAERAIAFAEMMRFARQDYPDNPLFSVGHRGPLPPGVLSCSRPLRTAADRVAAATSVARDGCTCQASVCQHARGRTLLLSHAIYDMTIDELALAMSNSRPHLAEPGAWVSAYASLHVTSGWQGRFQYKPSDDPSKFVLQASWRSCVGPQHTTIQMSIAGGDVYEQQSMSWLSATNTCRTEHGTLFWHKISTIGNTTVFKFALGPDDVPVAGPVSAPTLADFENGHSDTADIEIAPDLSVHRSNGIGYVRQGAMKVPIPRGLLPALCESIANRERTSSTYNDLIGVARSWFSKSGPKDGSFPKELTARAIVACVSVAFLDGVAFEQEALETMKAAHAALKDLNHKRANFAPEEGALYHATDEKLDAMIARPQGPLYPTPGTTVWWGAERSPAFMFRLSAAESYLKWSAIGLLTVITAFVLYDASLNIDWSFLPIIAYLSLAAAAGAGVYYGGLYVMSREPGVRQLLKPPPDVPQPRRVRGAAPPAELAEPAPPRSWSVYGRWLGWSLLAFAAIFIAAEVYVWSLHHLRRGRWPTVPLPSMPTSVWPSTLWPSMSPLAFSGAWLQTPSWFSSMVDDCPYEICTMGYAFGRYLFSVRLILESFGFSDLTFIIRRSLFYGWTALVVAMGGGYLGLDEIRAWLHPRVIPGDGLRVRRVNCDAVISFSLVLLVLLALPVASAHPSGLHHRDSDWIGAFLDAPREVPARAPAPTAPDPSAALFAAGLTLACTTAALLSCRARRRAHSLIISGARHLSWLERIDNPSLVGHNTALEIGLIAPFAKLTVRVPKASQERFRVMYQRFTPPLLERQPSVMANTQHNMLVGVTRRCIPETLILPELEPLIAFEKFVWAHFDELFPHCDLGPSLIGHAAYLARFPRVKRAALQRAFDDLNQGEVAPHILYANGIFIKVELGVKRRIHPDHPETLTKPRIINNSSPHYQMLVGPWITTIQSYVKAKTWQANGVVVLGTDRSELGDWFAKRVDNSDVFEADFNTFDATQSNALRSLIINIYIRKFGMPADVAAHMFERAREKKASNGKLGVSYTIDGTMASGDPDTYLSNTILNALVQAYAHHRATNTPLTQLIERGFSLAVSGDDSVVLNPCLLGPHIVPVLQQTFVDLGMSADVAYWDPLGAQHVGYCSSIFHRSEKGYYLGMTPGRILIKLGWIKQPEKYPFQALRANALGLWAESRGTPFVRELVDFILVYTAHVKVAPEDIARARLERAFTSSDTTPYGDSALRDLNGRYGFTNRDYHEICDHLGELATLPAVAPVGARFRECPLLARIVERDC